ncbi:MAG: winged helix-turn-helix domain-containing protein, partial [Thermomicrobiales bacterium]|nr:winged helix-turn-helix domain-containing protein [Thermomicrobiales bacterium]
LRLLRLLHDRAGLLCPRHECAAAIWGTDYLPGMDAGALDRVVSNLRRKLREVDPAADLILTRPALGYELRP